MKHSKLKLSVRGALFMIGLLVSLSSFAQDILIKGHVKDNTGEPVIGANIVIKGTVTGTITDFDGNFALQAPANATLAISYIGYKNQEIEINGQSTLMVTLLDDSELIDEIVVIGYGQVKKADATGSVLSVKPDEFNKGNQYKAEDALVGKIAGVNVIPASGEVGADATIRIRMGSSLSASNDPLIIIDGFPARGGANLSAINPNDIESFTVLKDASATAIYGSRASNGVIIVTTKKGAAGSKKPQINYNANFSVSTVYEHLDVLSADEFKQAVRELRSDNLPSTFQFGTANTDWQDEIFRSGFGHDHNVSVTGSYLNVPYRISIGYTDQQGIVKSNDYNRTNLGIGLNPKFFDNHLSVDLNVKGSFENNHGRDGGIISTATFFDPSRPIYDDTYDVNGPGLGYFMWREDNGGILNLAAVNPMASIHLDKNNKHTNRSIGSAAFNYKVHGFEDLSFNLNLGYDVSKEDKHEKSPENSPQMFTGNLKTGVSLDKNEVKKYRSTLLDFYANYNKDFNQKHNLNAMAGYGWQRFWKDKSETSEDWSGNELVVPYYEVSELYLLSFFGRANYSYDSRYMLTATLRADASSRFAKNSRWGYFPSAAFAWRMINEEFLSGIDVLSDLKLRLSYGQTGQQEIGSYYVHMPIYKGSTETAMYKFGDKWYTTYRPNGYDPNIKWETTETYNIGVDFGFLNHRISGSVDAYKRNTKDLLNKISIPAGSNFNAEIETNIGNMKSKGVEIALTGIPIKTKDWEWSVSGNFTWNASEITKLNVVENEANKASTQTGSAGGTGYYMQLHTVGETPYTFYLLRQAYDENGNYLDGVYLDDNGEQTTSENNKYITGKSSLAPYYFGLSTKLSYKNWDLGINAHGSAGNYAYNYLKASNGYESLYSSSTSSNILRNTYELKQQHARRYSDHYLENASFLRIDNIRIGYTFQKLWDTTSSLNVSVGIQNVYTFTGYSGIDPELKDGIDRNTYQRPRVFMMGLNLNF